MAKGTKKPGSGRTKGAFSFVNIPLEELNKKFADKTTPIRVSRLFAQTMGFTDLVTKRVTELNTEIQGQTPATKPKVTVTDLND